MKGEKEMGHILFGIIMTTKLISEQENGWAIIGLIVGIAAVLMMIGACQ